MKLEWTIAMPEQRLGVPYGPREGYGAGFPNIGFIDLWIEPERIDEIPEIRSLPNFKALVGFLNNDKSAFATLRTDSGADFFNFPGFPHSFFSFLTVCLRRMHPNQDKEVFKLMFDRFSESVSVLPIPVENVRVEFRLSLLSVPVDDDLDRHCLDFFVEAGGSTIASAKKSWGKGFNVLDSFMRSFNEQLISGKFDEQFQ